MKFGSMSRLSALAAATAAMLALAGCGSAVKLSDTPVESRQPTPVAANTGSNTASAGSAGSATSADANAARAQSQVAMVDLNRSTAGSTAGAAAASGRTLGRVVYFDFDSYVVKGEFQPLVDAYAKNLSASKSKRLVVEGHTDERGGREYNLALGQKRAEAVVKSLTLLGVGEGQVEAVSFGKERPADEAHDEDAWAKNRRAEMKDR